jgi:hypothetical protein
MGIVTVSTIRLKGGMMNLVLVNKRSSRPWISCCEDGLLRANVGSWLKLCYVCDGEKRRYEKLLTTRMGDGELSISELLAEEVGELPDGSQTGPRR